MDSSRAARRYTPLSDDEPRHNHQYSHTQHINHTSRQPRDSLETAKQRISRSRSRSRSRASRVSFVDEDEAEAQQHYHHSHGRHMDDRRRISRDIDLEHHSRRPRDERDGTHRDLRGWRPSRADLEDDIKDRVESKARQIEREHPAFSMKSFATQLTIMGLAAVGIVMGGKIADLDAHVANKKKEKRGLRGMYKRSGH